MAAPADWPAQADLVAASVRAKHTEIDRYAALLQDQPLTHNGHRYHADRGSLDTITTPLAVVLMGDDDVPVPTPAPVAGKWMSADRDQAGGRVLVEMSNGQFKQMARTLYNRNAAIWDAKQVHYVMVENMAILGATAEQILGYDHTAGWPEIIPAGAE